MFSTVFKLMKNVTDKFAYQENFEIHFEFRNLL